MRSTKGIIILIAVLLAVVIAGQDYYKNLGVPRNADQSQIKRAFKKLSLKYHPDKNKDDPKKAEEMFQKIVEAYEVLKDPKQKEIYDKFGEEGLKQNNQQQGHPEGRNFHHGGFDDIFSQFFGGGGQRGGGNFYQQQQQQQQQQAAKNMFSQSDVYELDMGGLSRFLRRQEVWVILFYKSSQRESLNLKDSYRELARKFYGILRVAAVDCDEEDALCEDEYEVTDTPSIQAFESNINTKGHRYHGTLTDIQSIANFSVRFMESYVRALRSQNYNEFSNENPQKNKVILFTQKKTTPPLFKALSKEYKEKLDFGEIRDTEQELIRAFNIQSYPTLLVLTDPHSKQGITYDGAFKKDQILKFLREYSYVKAASSQASAPSQVRQLTPDITKNPNNCGNQDTKLCFLIITANDSISSEEAVVILKSLAAKFADSKIKFFHLPRRLIELENIFDREDFSTVPAAVVIKGKRNRFSHFSDSQVFSIETLQIYLDEIIGGGGTFKPLHDQLDGNVFTDKSDL